jgi:hypothetical protein
MPTLLSREEFKRQVFARDKNKCVICGAPAVDAHHIMDRKLWEDGGYYLDNGVSLCENHHWEAELDKITPDELRMLLGLCTVLPPQLTIGMVYDKWGNPA